MLKKLSAKAVTLLLVAFTLILPSCSDDIFGNNQPTDIQLSSTLMEFDTIAEVQGRNLQLEATISLKGGGTSKDVIWEPPEDQSAFKVQSTAGGVLTFQIYKSGTYVISAHADYEGKHFKTAQCVITINDALTQLRIYDATNDNSFTGDSGTIELLKGNTVELSPIYTPTSTSQLDVLWSVDNAAVATISAKPNHKAVLTAVGPGKATVTLMSQENTSIKRTLQVIVNDTGENQSFGLRSVELNPTGADILIGKGQTFTATVIDGNSNEVQGGDVEFSLSNKNSFSLSNISSRSATVTAILGGEGMLTAKYTKDGESVYTEVPLKVTGDVQGISTPSSYINLVPGEEIRIDFSYLPEDTVQKGFEFKGVNTSVLGIIEQADDYIRFVARNEGTCEITVLSRYNSAVSTHFYVNVKKAVTNADRVRNVTLSENSIAIEPPFENKTITAEVFRRLDDGTVISDPEYLVDWSSSDTSIVAVSGSGNTATIMPKKPGSAKITATSRDNTAVTATCLITIGGNLKGLIPSVSSVAILKNDTTSVNITPTPYNAIYEAPTVQVSSDAVSVSLEQVSDGYRADITGLKIGDATVAYYIGTNKMAETKVSVYQDVPTTVRSIELSSASMYLKQDADRADGYLTAYAIDNTGSRLSDRIEVVPASDISEQVVRIERFDDNTFYVIPLNAGSADWFFYREGLNGIKSRLHVEVGGSAVQGETIRAIRMPYDSISLKEGASEEVTLVTIPLGMDPGRVTWTSTNADVAKAEGNGSTVTVKAIGAGDATITAETEGGFIATLAVKVYGEGQASDTTIAKATITGPDSSLSYKIFTITNKAFDLTAHAYHADGSEDKNENFTWTVSGDAVSALDIQGERRTASFLTKEMLGYDAPAVITATSVSNPDVSATFLVYVCSTTTIPEDSPIVFPEYNAVTIEKGKSMDIGFSIYPATYTNEGFSITSSDSCVSAELSAGAKKITVTGVEAGTSTVTVTDNKVTFTVRVTVVEKAEKVDAQITAVTLDRKYLSYDLADKALQSITATVWRGAEEDVSAAVEWESTDPEVVRVSQSGKMVAVIPQEKTGSAFIIAKAVDNTSASASCLVEVIDSTQAGEKLRYIMLSETSVRLQPGATLQLNVSGQPANLINETRFVWESSDTQIAEVSNGKITAVSDGVADITVKAMDGNEVLMSDSCRVTVKSLDAVVRTPASIKLSDILMTVSQEDMDKKFTITAGVYDDAGEYIPGRSVLWTVTDPEGAIEYETGSLEFAFSPRTAGTVTVEASIGSVSASAKIVVGAPKQLVEALKSISIWPNKLVTEKDKTVTLNATPIPATDETQILWTVDDTDVELTGNNRSANIKALKAGTFKVTAYSANDPKIKGEATLVVLGENEIGSEDVTGILLDKRSIVLDMADKALTSLNATVYVNGKADATQKVTWTVSDSLDGVITYSEENGTLIINKAGVGEGYITATSVKDTSFSATCLVQVIDTTLDIEPVLSALMISSTSLSMEKGGTYTFSTQVIPAGLEGVNVVWTSSDESVAKVTSTGVLTAMDSGKATITATASLNGIIFSQKCNVTVYSPSEEVVPARIAFSKNVANLSQDKMDVSDQVTATVYGSDGSVLTDGAVAWAIDDDEVARLEWAGNTAVVWPLSAGTTRVRASYRGLENNFIVVTGAATPAAAEKATGIVFNPGSLVLKPGATATVNAYTVPAGVESGIAFSITNPEIVKAEFSGKTVKIEALKAGSAKLKAVATDNPSISAEMTITVDPKAEGKVTAITLDKTYIALELDTKDLTQVNATTYVDGVATKNVPVIWSLEGLTDTQITATPNGTYGSSVNLVKKAKGEGWLVCTAKDYPEVFAKCRIEIVDPNVDEGAVVKRIDLSSALMTLSQEKMDSVYQITATVFGSDEKTMPGEQVVWSVDDKAGALEWQYTNNSIFFSPRNAGTATITASKGNVKAEAKVIVGATRVSDDLTGYSLNPSRITMEEGATTQINLLPIPSNAEYHPVWASDAQGVAKVTSNEDGAVVTAAGVGTANISVTDLDNPAVKGTVSVNVKAKGTVAEDEITALTIDRNHIVLDMADKDLTSIKATVYVNGKVSEREVTWKLDDSLVNAVSAMQISRTSVGISKKAVGSGFITATVQNSETDVFEAKCYIEVIDSTETPRTELVAASISSSSITLKAGDTYQYRIETAPADIPHTVTWASSDETIATVSSTGLVTGVAAGKATVSATLICTDKTGVPTGKVTNLTSTVNVYKEAVGTTSTPTYITLSDNVLYLTQEAENEAEHYTQINARVLDQNRVEIYGANIVWSVEDADVATVTPVGTGTNASADAAVRPVSAGSTMITATCGNAEASMLVVVGAPESAGETYAKSIVFSPSKAVVQLDDTIDITAHTVPAGSVDKLAFSVTNNKTISAVPQADGKTVKVTGLKVGEDSLLVRSKDNPNVSATITVSVVEDASNEVTSIKLDKTYIALELDTKAVVTLNATAYVGGEAQDDVPLTWSLVDINDTQVGVTVADDNGSTAYITKKAVGSGYIKVAAENGVYALCRIDITEAPTPVTAKISRIVLSENIVHLSQEEMDKGSYISARVYDTNGKEMTDSTVTWSVTPTSVVKLTTTADGKAYLMPLSAGTATLTATAGTVSNSAIIAVGAAPADDGTLKSIMIYPSSLTIYAGKAWELEAHTVPANYSGTISWNVTGANSYGTLQKTGDGRRVTFSASAADTNKELAPGQVVSGVKIEAFATAYPDIKTSIPVTIKAADLKNNNEVTAVTMDKASIYIDIAETKANTTLTATVYKGGEAVTPDKGAVEWTISDSLKDSLAYTEIGSNTISITRKADIKVGSGYITATSTDDDKFYASAYVEIVDSTDQIPEIRYVALSDGELMMKKGESAQLSLTIYPEKAGEGKEIEWTSQNGDVVYVNATGKITAYKAGTSVIKASVKGTNFSKTCLVTVSESIPTSIVLNKQIVHLTQGTTNSTSITATVYDQYGNNMNDATGTVWTIENSSIAKLSGQDSLAEVTPVSAGETKITARKGTAQATATIIVGEAVKADRIPTGIIIQPSDVTIEDGTDAARNSTVLTAYVLPSGLSTDDIEWSVQGTPYATIEKLSSNTARVTAAGVGETTVSAILKGHNNVIGNVKVKSIAAGTGFETSVTGISIDRTTVSLDKGSTTPVTMTATIYRGGKASTAVADAVTWSMDSDLSTIATWTNTGRNVGTIAANGTGTGSGYITAKFTDEDGGIHETKAFVEVSNLTSLSRLAFRETSRTMVVGEQAEFDLVGYPSTAYNRDAVKWSIAPDMTVADVSQTGLVTARKKGTTTLSAQIGTVSASMTLNVIESDATRIGFSQDIVYLAQDKADWTEITATPYNASGKATTGTVKWTGIDGSILDVKENGNKLALRAKDAGTVKITATLGDVSNSFTVIVGATTADKTLRSILTIPSQVVLKDTVDPRDSVTVNAYRIPATNELPLTWSTGNSGVATVSADSTTLGATITAAGAAGDATRISVTETGSGIKAEIQVNIVAESEYADTITGVKLDKSQIVLDLADKALATLTATVYKGGKLTQDEQVEWSWVPSDPSYANAVSYEIVSTGTGGNTINITKKAVGDGYIVAKSKTSGNFQTKAYVQVIDSTESDYEIQSAALSDERLTLYVGDTAALKLSLYPEAKSLLQSAQKSELESKIRWSVQDGTKVNVNEMTGVVTALQEGTTTIMAAVEGTTVTKQGTVIVKTPVATAISVNQPIVHLTQGMDADITVSASVTDERGYEIDAAPVWKTSSETIARVSGNGKLAVITPVGVGEARITAELGALKAEILVIVGEIEDPDKIPTGITMLPSRLMLLAGAKTANLTTTRVSPDVPVSFDVTVAVLVSVLGRISAIASLEFVQETSSADPAG